MTENRKLDDKKKTRKILKPTIAGTKASQARAKAINAQIHDRPTPLKRKRQADAPTLSSTYKMTAAGLKERPSWDLRGKVADMTQLIELNNQKLDELRKFKRELEITKDEKESQEKEAIQKAAQLRTELQEMERAHAINRETIHASQRIEYQKLEDDQLHYTRRLTTIEIEVADAKRKLESEMTQLEHVRLENDALKASIQSISTQFETADQESRELDKAIETLERSIRQKEEENETKERKTETIESTVQQLQAQLNEAETDRSRLLNKIRDLEVKVSKKSIKKGQP
ncbi:hypothetical protein EDC96DRAFT_576814 [Choanephora cucurbitarum]|nr:hypothetical protein EDC96DRAFT_576814 [Choanephora cucurbitarum]